MIHLECIESTNNYAAKLIQLPNWYNGTVIVADIQTKGRGQQSTNWISQPGNLHCSYLFDLSFLKTQFSWIWSAAVAIAVQRTISNITPQLNPKIKWPNDILADKRKVAGILIENSVSQRQIESSIVGIGINVAYAPEDVNACSMQLPPNQVNTILYQLSKQLEEVYFILKSGDHQYLLRAYHNELWKYGQKTTIVINGVTIDTMFLGISEDGRAKFLTEQNELLLGIKEFQWKELGS